MAERDAPWDPSMPLRWDASDEEMLRRDVELYASYQPDNTHSFARECSLVQTIKEFAAASVAHALHERDGAPSDEEDREARYEPPFGFHFSDLWDAYEAGAQDGRNHPDCGDDLIARSADAYCKTKALPPPPTEEREAMAEELFAHFAGPAFVDARREQWRGNGRQLSAARRESTYHEADALLAAGFRRSPVQERGADTARLDWMEGEPEREQNDPKYRSVFRRNIPITREVIDAARSASPPAPPEHSR